MKKGLKILGYTLGPLVLLLGLGATYVQMRGIPTYPVQAPALQIMPDSVRVAEGKRLVGMTCAQCHRSGDGRLLRQPMQPYAAMSEAEAAAIWVYLQTVPAVHHPVDRAW